MNDEDMELIKQLRNSKGWPTLGNAAADAIEGLIVRIASIEEFGRQYHDGWMTDEGRLSLADAEIEKLCRRIVELEKALTSARIDALEKAARMAENRVIQAEDYYGVGAGVMWLTYAAAIRALANEAPE